MIRLILIYSALLNLVHPRCNHFLRKHRRNLYSINQGRQSPVNIDTLAAADVNIPPLVLTNYGIQLSKLTITNTGTTVRSTVNQIGETDITIHGAGLKSAYVFEEFHFHWNLNTLKGSEHTIDRVKFAAEAHIVHRNSKYGSLQEALTQPDGLAVIGVLIEIAERDNPKFEELFAAFDNVRTAGSKVTLLDAQFILGDLLPPEVSMLFRYKGSLTTYPFSEVVDWIVMSDKISLSLRQIRNFGQLLDYAGLPIGPNDREVQPIGRRIIYRKAGGKHYARN